MMVVLIFRKQLALFSVYTKNWYCLYFQNVPASYISCPLQRKICFNLSCVRFFFFTIFDVGRIDTGDCTCHPHLSNLVNPFLYLTLYSFTQPISGNYFFGVFNIFANWLKDGVSGVILMNGRCTFCNLQIKYVIIRAIDTEVCNVYGSANKLLFLK